MSRDDGDGFNVILFMDISRLLQRRKLPGLDLLYVDDYEEPDDW